MNNSFYKAPASFSNWGSSFLRAWRSEFPPMCSLLMKMLGTERWLVISSRASWIAAPSSIVTRISFDFPAPEDVCRGMTYRLDPTQERSKAHRDRSKATLLTCSTGNRTSKTRLHNKASQRHTQCSDITRDSKRTNFVLINDALSLDLGSRHGTGRYRASG